MMAGVTDPGSTGNNLRNSITNNTQCYDKLHHTIRPALRAGLSMGVLSLTLGKACELFAWGGCGDW